ncbi:MAG: hypothetical protein ACFFD4_39165 [Candidatus Odinarchaeota archaeon]
MKSGRNSDVLEIYKRLPLRLLRDGILTEKVYSKVMEDIEAIEESTEEFNKRIIELIEQHGVSKREKHDSKPDLVDLQEKLVGTPLKRPVFSLIAYFASIAYREQLQTDLQTLEGRISELARKFDGGNLSPEETRANLASVVKARDITKSMIASLDEWEPDFLKASKEYNAIKTEISKVATEESLDLKKKNIQLLQLKHKLDEIISSTKDKLIKVRHDLEYIETHFPELVADTSLTYNLLKEVRASIKQIEVTITENFQVPIKYDLDSDLRVLVNVLPEFASFLTSYGFKYEQETEIPTTYISTKRNKRAQTLQLGDTLITNEQITLTKPIDLHVVGQKQASGSTGSNKVLPVGKAFKPGETTTVDESSSQTGEEIKPLLSSSIAREEIVDEQGSESSPSLQPTLLDNPWQLVSYLMMDDNNNMLGSCSFPYLYRGELVLSYYVEKPLPDFLIQSITKEILDYENLPESIADMKKIVTQQVSQALEVPLEAALLPSVILEYCCKANLELEETETSLEDLLGEMNYLFLSDILSMGNKSLKKGNSTLSKVEIESLLFLPPPKSSIGGNILDFNVININAVIGLVKQIINQESIGHLLGIEQDRPSKTLVRKLLKVKRQAADSSDPYFALQSIIARKIDTFEGESLLYWNLWKYCWSEKIPFMPWDILQEFVAFVPVVAVESVDFNSKTITLKRGSAVLEAENLFQDLSYYSVINTEGEEAGKALGISVNEEGQLEFLWCALGTDEIIRRMRKPSTPAALERLKKRIASALGVKKEEEVLIPANLFKYFLFYATFQEFESMFGVMDWLKENFELRSTPFAGISRFDFSRKLLYLAN